MPEGRTIPNPGQQTADDALFDEPLDKPDDNFMRMNMLNKRSSKRNDEDDQASWLQIKPKVKLKRFTKLNRNFRRDLRNDILSSK